jgi:diguanylate cyclase (GGDEF)-like protein
MADGGLAAQHLVELLAIVSSCEDEESAVRAAVERAAETVEAEVCGVVFGDTVASAIGLPAGSAEYGRLATVAPGRGTLELPGMATCSVGAALLGRPDEGTLVVARAGEPFTVAEHNLIRGMARVLGLTLRMLRTLDAERRRERVMRHLYQLQRSISRRTPLTEVLRTTIAAVTDVLAGDGGRAELWLVDAATTAPTVLGAASRALPGRPGGPVEDDLVAAAIRTDRLREGVDERGRSTAAAPVHEHGRTVGALRLTVAAGHRLAGTDRDNLLSFAEHVSLALTDAKTVRDMDAARHDALTGLASRALFDERLRQYLADSAAASRLALLFIDLDRFKSVNDTLGHAAGDAVLIEVARRLQAIVRGGDLVGRLGGDEFGIVLFPSTEQHAAEVATRIVDELCLPYAMPHDGYADVGASVGVAVSTGPDELDLIRRADTAMYDAKRAGRGCFVVHPSSSAAPAVVRR